MELDTPNRIALGGIALAAGAGLAAPLLSWTVSGPLIALCSAVALWGFVPIVQSALPWPSRSDTPRPAGSDLRELVTRKPKQSNDRISLQDAVAFAMYGHWPTADETIFGEDDSITRADEVTQRMRQFAHDGKLVIWGRKTKLSLHVPIPQDFWVNNQIDFTSIWGLPETPKTDSVVLDTAAEFSALQVSKGQMESLWTN